MAATHPFYQSQRSVMESAMRERIALALPLIDQRQRVEDPAAFEAEVLAEFEVVLTQIPYVGGAVMPRPNDNFEFGVNYRACGFGKLADKYGDREILPIICGLDFVAYETRGINLERTQTLAGGASHCNFRFTSTEKLS